MRKVADELTTIFSEQTGIKTQALYDKTDTWVRAIRAHEGSFDILLADNIKCLNDLYINGFTESPKSYATAPLALWSMKKWALPLDWALLTDPSVKTIALPKPDTHEQGALAIKLLRHAGIYEQVKHKLLFAKDISEVNQWVFAQTADVGITELASLKVAPNKGKGAHKIVSAQQYQAVERGFVLVKGHRKEAKSFGHFLTSVSARTVLERYGYAPTKP
jgi:molybdate transport system substrate-binding protein